jgi:hypothetical protein
MRTTTILQKLVDAQNRRFFSKHKKRTRIGGSDILKSSSK